MSPPLSLYVHLPWCVRKCPYCDFNSHEAKGEIPEQRYLDAVMADLEASLPLVWGRRVVSVFIGGGTPSLFSPEAIGTLIADLRASEQIRLYVEEGTHLIGISGERCLGGADQTSVDVTRARPVLLRVSMDSGAGMKIAPSAF